MRLFAQMTGFLTFFVVITFLVNYYIFMHLSYMLATPRELRFWVLMVLSTVFFSSSLLLSGVSNCAPMRAYAAAAGVWLAFLFGIGFMLLIYDIVRAITTLPWDVRDIGMFLLFANALLMGAGIVNARMIRTRRFTLSDPRIERPVRLAQISDVHLGPVLGKDFLVSLVCRVRELEPDALLISGDLFDGPYRYGDDILDPLSDLPFPAFFSYGNHDHYAGHDVVDRLVAGAGIVHLGDGATLVGGIRIIGVDDARGFAMVPAVMDRLDRDPGRFSVLVHHKPLGYREAQSRGVDLMLSGHTHGGQFMPFLLFGAIIWKRYAGMYVYGGMRHYVSRGAGTWGPPVRLGSSPEVAVFDLIPSRWTESSGPAKKPR